MLNAVEEIRFWTGIMRDHGEFILSSLSYDEQEAIYTARFFKETFAGLHEQSKQLSNGDTNAIELLASECTRALVSFIQFKRLLLAKLLQCQLGTSLPPTFYNHMINEAVDFCNTLFQIRSHTQMNPFLENLSLHKTWLPDAAGHAATIACDLDPVEKPLINEAHEFEKCFLCLSTKADELEKMLLRACLNDGALMYLNEEAFVKISEFICYLDKIRRLRLECKALGVLKPLIPDHMIREENHYLKHLEGLKK
jgi:hypothetical protein